MKAFLIESGESHGSAGVAAVVFSENETDAFRRFTDALNSEEDSDLHTSDSRCIVSNGERLHRDGTMLITETYRQNFEVQEIDVNVGDVIVAADYYGPSLLHYPTA